MKHEEAVLIVDDPSPELVSRLGAFLVSEGFAICQDGQPDPAERRAFTLARDTERGRLSLVEVPS